MKRFVQAVVALLFMPVSILIPQSPPLIMVTEVWAPYRMNDAAGTYGFAGIDIDLMTALEKKLGRTIEIRRVPWARALDMMRQGQADMITGIAWTQERAEYMNYVPTSYSEVRPMFFTQKGNADTVKSYEDLQGKTIGKSTHSAYFEPFNSDTSLQKVSISTEAQILRMLSLGRIDLAIGTDPNLSWDVVHLGYKDLVEPTTWQPDPRTPLYIAFSKKSAASNLVDSVDRSLKEMLEDGTLRAILLRYR